MSDVSTTLTDPFILTPEEMDQLNLDDGHFEDDSSQDIPLNNDQNTQSVNPRDEERKRKNREAAKRLREKGTKKQTDMRQDILDLSAKQTDLKYKAIQAAQQFLELIKVAEEHRKSCNLQYEIKMPTISPEIAKLPGMSDLVKSMKEAQQRYASRHEPPSGPMLSAAQNRLMESQREKRTHDDEQVRSDADVRTIKKLRKILNMQAKSSNGAPMNHGDRNVIDYLEAGPSSCITTSVVENPMANCPKVAQQGADESLLLSVVKSYNPKSQRSSVARPSQGRAYSTESNTSEAASMQTGMSTIYQRGCESPYLPPTSATRSVGGEPTAAFSQNHLKVIIPAPSNHHTIPNWGVLGDTGMPTVHAENSHLSMGQAIVQDTSRDEALTRIKAELMSPMEPAQQTPMSVLHTNVQNQPGSSMGYVLEPLQPTMNGQGLHNWNHPQQSEAMFLQIQNPSTQFENLGEMIANGMHATNGEDF